MKNQSEGGPGNNNNSEPPLSVSPDGKRMQLIVKKSAVPIWAAAVVWVIAALFFPMYRVYHYTIIMAVSILTAVVLDKVIPKKREYVEIPEAPPSTGNAELDAVISEIRTASAKLDFVKTSIEEKHHATASVIADISVTISKISAAVEEKPGDLPIIRRFLSYYLPTIGKLTQKYQYLDSQNEAGLDNVKSTMDSIDNALVTVKSAMKKQLDALFADDALDIATDIEVLEALLSRDGLA